MTTRATTSGQPLTIARPTLRRGGKTLFCALALTLGGSAAACKGQGGDDEGEPAAWGERCTEHADCAEGLLCDVNVCTELCKTDEDCQVGYDVPRDCAADMCRFLCVDNTCPKPEGFEGELMCVARYDCRPVP